MGVEKEKSQEIDSGSTVFNVTDAKHYGEADVYRQVVVVHDQVGNLPKISWERLGNLSEYPREEAEFFSIPGVGTIVFIITQNDDQSYWSSGLYRHNAHDVSGPYQLEEVSSP